MMIVTLIVNTEYLRINKTKYVNSQEIIKGVAVSSFDNLGAPIISNKNKNITVSSKSKDIEKCKEKKLNQVGFQIY